MNYSGRKCLVCDAALRLPKRGRPPDYCDTKTCRRVADYLAGLERIQSEILDRLTVAARRRLRSRYWKLANELNGAPTKGAPHGV